MAKVLYLLRHTKSSWDDPSLDDMDRPLAPRGQKAARALAVHMEGAGVSPGLVLCSPARRARDTLDLVRSGLPPATRVRIDKQLYRADPADVLRIIRNLTDDLSSVMVVGHNPTMQRLALTLAAPAADVERLAARFPTGALAELSFPGNRWAKVAAGTGRLIAFVTPKDLK
ncbi:MAG TPA: histidine phosphatase family protein [Actinomycetota bacterium]|jgi:phosphohistidine phosphatase